MKKTIVHISTHYFPINGGQQIYIENLKNKLDEYEHLIIQIKEKGIVYPTHVIPVEIPRLFKIKALAFYYFNFAVKAVLRDLISDNRINVNNDIFLCHYAFHYSIVNRFRNAIILSHGVEWDGPGNYVKKLYHFHRKWINASLLRKSNVKLVSNDANYFKNLGLDEVTISDSFNEVFSNKWLVPNCVDTAMYQKLQSVAPFFPSKSIVIPRNIVPQRGMEIVIQAFNRLRLNNKMLDYKLYIVGAKYDMIYYNLLVSMVKEMMLEEVVVFYGSIPYGDTPRLYNSSDLVIIFSLFREGTSLAALEAMSCGSVVITSDVGGLKDLPTVKATAADLDEVILNSLEKRKEISQKQSSFVKSNFDINRWVDTWRIILNS